MEFILAGWHPNVTSVGPCLNSQYLPLLFTLQVRHNISLPLSLGALSAHSSSFPDYSPASSQSSRALSPPLSTTNANTEQYSRTQDDCWITREGSTTLSLLLMHQYFFFFVTFFIRAGLHQVTLMLVSSLFLFLPVWMQALSHVI